MLTTQQKSTVKADILANPDLNAFPNTLDGAVGISNLYNLLASPVFIVWRTNVPVSDVKKAIVWTEYISRTVAERSTFELIISDNILNAADTNVRQGIQDCFSGATGANTRANLTTIAKRSAARFEKLLATGTGSDPSPAVMNFEGPVGYQDIYDARNS